MVPPFHSYFGSYCSNYLPFALFLIFTFYLILEQISLHLDSVFLMYFLNIYVTTTYFNFHSWIWSNWYFNIECFNLIINSLRSINLRRPPPLPWIGWEPQMRENTAVSPPCCQLLLLIYLFWMEMETREKPYLWFYLSTSFAWSRTNTISCIISIVVEHLWISC